MTRYQCPFCEAFHRSEEMPTCPTHTLGYSARCETCVWAARQTPCGGGQS